MFIAISKYLKSLNEVDQYRHAHWDYLQQHFDAGKLLVSGRQQPAVGGVIISAAISKNEFEAILQQDPFVLSESASYEIIEFNASFMAPALKALLDPLSA